MKIPVTILFAILALGGPCGAREFDRMGVTFKSVDVDRTPDGKQWRVHTTGASALECLSVVAGRAGVELALSEKSRATLWEIQSLKGVSIGRSWKEVFAQVLDLCEMQHEMQHPGSPHFIGLWGNSYDYQDESAVPAAKANKTFYITIDGEIRTKKGK